MVRGGRNLALFGQRVRRPELGDFGDDVAGFRFGNEAGFLGEKEDTFIHGRRDRPGEDDAGHRLHCANGGANGGALESSAFEDERMRKNVLLDGAGVACKKISRAAVGLRNFFTCNNDEHYAPRHLLGCVLQALKRGLSLADRRRVPPP